MSLFVACNSELEMLQSEDLHQKLVAKYQYSSLLRMLEIGHCKSAWLGTTSLVPSPHCFWLHEVCRGPGIFSHIRDAKGRKVVERTKVPGNLPHVSS